MLESSIDQSLHADSSTLSTLIRHKCTDAILWYFLEIVKDDQNNKTNTFQEELIEIQRRT